MLTEIQASNRHFNTFYQDNSLLIQFITVEFLQIYHLTYQIKALIQDRLDSLANAETFISSLTEMLTRLVGYLPQQERSSLSHWTKGSLTKLKEYCEQFSHNSFHQNKEHIHLHMAAYQVWLAAIHHMELLNSLHINPYLPQSDVIVLMLPIKRAFNALELRFNQVIRSIPRVFSDYYDNENVVLFLLRKRSQLTEIYGVDFLYKRFKWQKKIKELILFVKQRYQARGFEGLLSTIQLMQDAED